MRRFGALVLLLAAAASQAVAQSPAQRKPAAKPPVAAPKEPAKKEPAKSGPAPDLAYGAYQRGLYVTAFREANQRIRANSNDAAAMTLIGELYNQGLGVKRDFTDAAAWYRLAAQRGSPHAMAALGMMSLEGRGLQKDAKAARDWLEKAATAGEPLAAFNLALVLLDHGGDADIARAAKLLESAAKSEIPEAQHALGVLYSRGQGGLPKDKTKAALLYQRSAYNGSLIGEVEYGIVLFNGDGIEKNERLAARQFLHAAGRGNAIAQNRLARLYAVGRGDLPKNLVESLTWHTMAKRQGLNDSWLDEQLDGVSDADRAQAEQRATERSAL